jgi:hypothetical protein
LEVRRKPQAFAAVAVMQVGIMEIECSFVMRLMLLGAASSSMLMASGEQLHERSAIEAFGDVGKFGFAGLLDAWNTLV